MFDFLQDPFSTRTESDKLHIISMIKNVPGENSPNCVSDLVLPDVMGKPTDPCSPWMDRGKRKGREREEM